MKASPLLQKYIPFGGGLDEITPQAEIKPGRILQGTNWECAENGGYRFTHGFERFDGQPLPSTTSYWLIDFDSGSTAIVAGNMVYQYENGLSSPATASGKALTNAVLESGSYVGGDAAGYLVLTNVEDTFVDNGILYVSSVDVATAASAAVLEGSESDTDNATWKTLAVTTARGLIAAPTGSGPIRGVCEYNDTTYCFRDNTAGTACQMWQATDSGWSLCSLGRSLSFTSGGTYEIQEDDTITGQNSGATAKVKRVIVDSGSGMSLVYESGGTFEVKAGDVIIGETSGAFATVESVVLSSGTWAGGNAAGNFVLESQTGTFQEETIKVGSNLNVATLTGDSTGSQWDGGNAAGRLIIYSQSGTFQSETINVGATSNVATIAGNSTANSLVAGGKYEFVVHNFIGSSTGYRMYGCDGASYGFEWDGYTFVPILTSMSAQITNGYKLYFSDALTSPANGIPVVGETIQWASAGNLMQGVVYEVVVESGHWINGDAAGFFVLTSVSDVGSSATPYVLHASGSIAIGLTVGSEIPLQSGLDTPEHIAVYKNHLFYSFRNGSVQHSGIGTPYKWTIISGAGFLGIGENVIGMSIVQGEAMLILGRNKTDILYGSSAADWNIVSYSSEAGGIEWTLQNLGWPIYLDDPGVKIFTAGQNFGDFDNETLTKFVRSTLEEKRGLAVASIYSTKYSQYRLFFSDATALFFTFDNQKLIGVSTLIEWPYTVSCCWRSEDENGEEAIYFGATNGMVYRMNSGPSFDGADIEAFMRIPYHHYDSIGVNKRFRKVVLECDVRDTEASIELKFSPEFDYADSDSVGPGLEIQADVDIQGGGGVYGYALWDRFVWDSVLFAKASGYITGIGENMALLISCTSAAALPFVISGMTVTFSKLGRVR